jgi:hypothetical protein
MAFPNNLTNWVDGVTELEAWWFNNVEAYLGVVGSTEPTSLNYKLTNAASIDPGHKHTGAGLSGGVDGDVFYKAAGAWTPGTPDAAGLVAKTGDQSIAGVKTFASIPVGPAVDPTLADQLTRKAYVDAAIDADIATHAALPNVHHNQAHDIQGADHTASGLTAGQVLRATGATSFAFQAIQANDLPSGIDALKIGAGLVDNTEFGYLNGVTSAIQSQIDAKLPTSTYQSPSSIDPGHKHSKVWESDGGAEALNADAGGVLNLPAKTAPGSSAADTAKLWVEDVNGEAGKAGLHLMNEVPAAVKLIVPGVYRKTDTGDPAGYFEGMLVINTMDNTLKMYADAGWRTLASWS